MQLLWGNHKYRMLSVLSEHRITSLSDVEAIRKKDPRMEEWLQEGGMSTLRHFCCLKTQRHRNDVQCWLEDALRLCEVVTGHTPILLIDPKSCVKILHQNGHIAIGCGAYITGILGCLCLDTTEEYYIDSQKYDRYN